MPNKIIYIAIILVILICSVLSSIVSYLYFRKEKGINVDGTWLSKKINATLLLTDNDSNIIQFKDMNNPTFVLPRSMIVTKRTATYLEAVHNGIQGEVIKFISKDGNTGIYSINDTVSYVYQKT